MFAFEIIINPENILILRVISVCLDYIISLPIIFLFPNQNKLSQLLMYILYASVSQ